MTIDEMEVRIITLEGLCGIILKNQGSEALQDAIRDLSELKENMPLKSARKDIDDVIDLLATHLQPS